MERTTAPAPAGVCMAVETVCAVEAWAELVVEQSAEAELPAVARPAVEEV